MNIGGVKGICGAIAQSRRPGETVSLSIGGAGDECEVRITEAPSHVVEAIGKAYYIAVSGGAAVVSGEEC